MQHPEHPRAFSRLHLPRQLKFASAFILLCFAGFIACAATPRSSASFAEVYREIIRNDPDFGPVVVPIISSSLKASLRADVPVATFTKKTPWKITFGSVELNGFLSNDVRFVYGNSSARFPFIDPFTGAQTGVISMIWKSDRMVLRITCNSDLLDVLDLYAGATQSFADVAPLTIIVGQSTNRANLYYKGKNSNRFDARSQLSFDTGNVTGLADYTPPTVNITTPAPNYSGNPAFNVSGLAFDNLSVAGIFWRWAKLTDDPTLPASHWNDWQQVDIQGGSPTRAGWRTGVDMSFNAAGTNIFWVISKDIENHNSPIVARPFFYAVPSTFTALTTGNGVVRGDRGVHDQANLIIQRRYSVLGVPVGPNNIFRNWTDASGNVISVVPRYDFLMRNSLTLQANFGPNPFPQVAGIYDGLFIPVSGSGGSRLDSGLLLLTLSTHGTYSGTVTLESGIHRFSGKFVFKNPVSGAADTTFQVNVPGAQPLVGTLHLPGNGTSGLLPTLTGSLSIFDGALGQRITTTLTAGYSPGNAGPVTPGLYNFQIPTAVGTEQTGPAGYGCGNILVRSNGTALTIINVADHTTQVTCNGAVTQDGRLPVCASLYGHKGLFVGWFRFENQATDDVHGEDIRWLKQRSNVRFYPDGFQRVFDGTVPNVTGSFYTPPKKGTNIFGWTSGTVSFADVIFSGSQPVIFNPLKNQVTFANGNPEHFRIAFAPTSGNLTGTFSSSPIKSLRAVVLPKSNTILGYFLDENQSGFIALTSP